MSSEANPLTVHMFYKYSSFNMRHVSFWHAKMKLKGTEIITH